MPNRPEWEVQSKGSLEALPQGEPVCDSRGEVRNKIFVCIEGERHDGHTDAAGVLRRGAAAIVTGKKLGLPREYTVPDPRAALGLLAARYWGEPAAALRLIGITGTNGKTTTGASFASPAAKRRNKDRTHRHRWHLLGRTPPAEPLYYPTAHPAAPSASSDGRGRRHHGGDGGEQSGTGAAKNGRTCI